MLSMFSCVVFGADPEFFFEKGSSIVGSERILPPEGLKLAMSAPVGVVLDGVQAEIHLTPQRCRAYITNELKYVFIRLKEHLSKMKGLTCNFSSVVEVSEEEMALLGEESRKLGCAPSHNIYQKTSISVDPSTYRVRSAGGHLHLGLEDTVFYRRKVGIDRRKELVPILDILVGNTSVMIDRDPQAAERRQVYGRAGEYRLPQHGLEYRTLSNFWLRANPLMSLMMGLARLSVAVLEDKVNIDKSTAYDELVEMVPSSAVTEAINNSDLELAKKNWGLVKVWVKKHVSDAYFPHPFPFTPQHLPLLDHFFDVIEKKGIEAWFPEDPMYHWCNVKEGHISGWESFLSRQLTKSMQEANDNQVVSG